MRLSTQCHQNKFTTHSEYQSLKSVLQDAGIELIVTRKRVKHINFRIKPHLLSVSVPYRASDTDIVTALSKRIDWVVTQHTRLLKHQRQQCKYPQDDKALLPVSLWGEPQPLVMGDSQRIEWYRKALQSVMPQLFAKWQPIVGVEANEMRVKKMKTRWGSCNTRAKRIWLSVYLPAYPIQCTEYVIVHELCHLHHANHSPAFWNEVKHSMPDYKYWHDMLAGKMESVNAGSKELS